MDSTKERERQRRRHVVCEVADIPPGERLIVPIGPHGVGVYNVGGSFYAVNNYCPHEGAQVCLGGIRSSNEWDEERREYVPVLEGRVLRCPWHQWEFDIATGDSLAAPVRKVKTYRVDIENGKVVVTI